NDASLLPISHAIHELPTIKGEVSCSPIGSPNLFAEGQNVAQADARNLRNKDFKSLNDEEERRELSPLDAESKNSAMAPAVGFEPTT
ncbi:MAG: hypothetical protein VYB73_00970, partial [Verrucomicrobiota bacterium]|nr:hypothetical protein [Verrucomicrobiota bacterium]